MDNSKVVILGTAHGVNTPGKCSPDKKFREYKFSREVINDLKPKLEALGLKVYIDITQDEVLGAESLYRHHAGRSATATRG